MDEKRLPRGRQQATRAIQEDTGVMYAGARDPVAVKLAALVWVIGLWSPAVDAHSGATVFIGQVPVMEVDGDLSDWPSDLRSYEILLPEYGVPPDGEGDLSASFRMGFNPERNALYVAVDVEDGSTVIDTTDMWNTQDGCELYIDLDHTDVSQPTQFAVWGVRLQRLEDLTGLYEAAVQRKGNRHTYEFRVDVGPMSADTMRVHPGQIVGVDVVVCDMDEDGSFSWMAWGPGSAKFGAPARVGDAVLMMEGQVLGSVQGQVAWKGGEEDTPPTSVEITSLDTDLSLVVNTDLDGSYSTVLPTGGYRVEVSDFRIGGRAPAMEIDVAGDIEIGRLVAVPQDLSARIEALLSRLKEDHPRASVTVIEEGESHDPVPTPIGPLATAPSRHAAGSGDKIAYLSDTEFNDGEHGDVYVMDADGSNRIRLTHNFGGYIDPEGTTDIYVRRKGGGERLSLPVLMGSRPTWSPDGQRLAFASAGAGGGDIYTANADWSEVTRITASDAVDSHPVWSPDGDRLAFNSNRSASTELYAIDATGGEAVVLTRHDLLDDAASWSPDGRHIAVTATVDGNQEIYSVAVDGGEAVNLTHSSAQDRQPSWSPDGERIAFTSNRYFSDELFVMAADGSGPINYTNTGSFNGGAAWSADGDQLLFVSERDRGTEIYTMDKDASNQVRLTANPLVVRNGWDPCWVPAESPTIGALQTPEYQRQMEIVTSDVLAQANFNLRSTNSAERARVTFANASKRTVSVYWVDFTGIERLNQTLVPGESIEVQTWQYHLWRLKDALGERTIRSLLSGKGSQVVLIQ